MKSNEVKIIRQKLVKTKWIRQLHLTITKADKTLKIGAEKYFKHNARLSERPDFTK